MPPARNRPDPPVGPHESRFVSCQARAAVANTRAEEVRTEAMIEPDALRDLDDIRADRLAHVRDLVDERDASHEECIRGELDHLGRRDVCPHYRSIDSPEERLDSALSSSAKAPITIRSGLRKSRTAC